MVIHDRKGQNSEGHAPQRLTQRLDRAQQTTNHTTACEALRSLLACLFVRRTGCRCDVSTGPRGGSWVRFPAGSARRDHPRPPQRRLLARTVRLRLLPRSAAPRSFTVYGFSVLHALRLLARPRSAAPLPSTDGVRSSSLVHALRLLARTRPVAPRSYTLCGSSLVHALPLLARPRSAVASRSSSFTARVSFVVVCAVRAPGAPASNGGALLPRSACSWAFPR